jgi:hypothetical protein
MADRGPVWRKIAERHGLVELDLTELVGWPFDDFILHTESDVVSNVNKIHEYGIKERMDSTKWLIAAMTA